MNDIVFEIEDFGHINKAKIDLGKINIVCGINGSGKTTASKIIYSLLAPYSEVGSMIFKEMLHVFAQTLKLDIEMHTHAPEVEKVHNKLSKLNDDFIDMNKYIDIKDDIHDLILFFKNPDKIESNKLSYDAFNVWNLIDSYSNDTLKSSEIIAQLFNTIFGNSLNLINEWNENAIIKSYNRDESFLTKLCFPLKDYPLNIRRIIDKENYKPQIFIKGKFHINEVFYIETPFLLDFFPRKHSFLDWKGLKLIDNTNFRLHQSSLLLKLNSENISSKFSQNNYNSKLLNLFDKILNGAIDYDHDKDKFFYKENNKEYDMPATASGIKAIGVLKALVMKNLDSNSLIIMDEPEVHLHPEWQFKLAELIVKLSKEGNLNFYINSHSPQFIEAIETLSMVHDYVEGVNYYLTQPSNEDKNKFDIEPIKKEELNKIYNSLGAPYIELAKIKGKLLAEKSKKGRDSYKLSDN